MKAGEYAMFDMLLYLFIDTPQNHSLTSLVYYIMYSYLIRKCLSNSMLNLQILFGLVNRRSQKTKIVVAKATFNMLADPGVCLVTQ